MLPERYRELLTAYVDGELSARQRRHVLRLLHRSVEARRLLQRLQSDSDALIHLPKPRLDRDLAEPVLQKITAARPLPIRPARRFGPPRAYPLWAGAAAAAAVLFLIGTASYCFFSSVEHRAAPALAQNQTNPPAEVPDVNPPTVGPHDIAPTPAPQPDHSSHSIPPTPPAVDVAHQPPADPNPATAPDKDEPILTSPLMEAFPDLKSLPPSTDVPSTFRLHELDEKKFLGALPKDALHIEVLVPNANRAFDRLQGVLKSHHVDLLIDATAEARLKHPNPRSQTNYVLYGEGPDRGCLARLLQQLAADDKKAAEKKPGDGLFDALVIHPLNKHDHKVLEDLMGVDPTPIAAPKETGPLGVDPRKPVSDQTAAQVAASLGQGKPGAGRPADHSLLVLPYNPVRPRHDSVEIKHFLDERKPLRPGTLQVLLVLRNSGK